MHSFRSIVNIGRHVHDLSKAITYINVHDANVRSTIIQLSKRVYSSNANNEPNTEKGPPTPTATKLPALMKVPYSHLLSGLPLYGPLSWIAKVFIIRQIEPEFDMYDFKYGAAQALYVTSKYLSQRKYNEVQELFLPQTLKALKRNLDKMTDEQRQEIHITQGDTIDVFPYQAGITNGINDEQYLEITVIFRVQKPKEPNGYVRLSNSVFYL